MKVPRGTKVEDVPMRTNTDFQNAAKKANVTTHVIAVESSNDYASLIRLLSSMVRPFAVNILTVK